MNELGGKFNIGDKVKVKLTDEIKTISQIQRGNSGVGRGLPDYMMTDKTRWPEDHLESIKNNMNKSETLNEYKDPATRLTAVKNTDIDRALKMIFQWVRMGTVSYDEFEELTAEFVAKVHKHI